MLKNEARGCLHAQNSVLYAFGCLVNTLLLGRRGLEQVAAHGLPSLYAGFNPYTWGLVASLTFLGLATAAVLKHADNMIRSLGYVGSIVLASAVSATWLGVGLTPTFTVGSLLACAGIVAYMRGPVRAQDDGGSSGSGGGHCSSASFAPTGGCGASAVAALLLHVHHVKLARPATP
jgi:hypothetical protein